MNIHTQPITLDCADLVEGLRKKYQHMLSSHAFDSLYLWREQMALSLYLEEELFSVQYGIGGENAWFFPCGDETAIVQFVEKIKKRPQARLCYMRRKDAQWLDKKFPGEWHIKRAPECDEYLYDEKGHAQLVGKTYANMRTQVHKVEREYEPFVRMLDETTRPDALFVIEGWSHGKHRFGSCTLRDDTVDKEAVCLQKELGILGIVLYLAGKPVAVTAGFPLGNGVFDMAIAKSNVTTQGVSYYAKRELFLRCGCRIINMEEDLGILGLRQMKQGLKPCAMNEIWEASL